MTYADSESILKPENNGKQNPDKSYVNEYQKHVAYNYGYKLVCVDDKFNNSMIKENKYCTEIMKKHFNKKLIMTKKDDEDFENSTKCWICNNVCWW